MGYIDSIRESVWVTNNKETSFSLTFFVGMAIYLTLIVIIGFWPTYFGNLLLGLEPTQFGLVEISWKVDLHAAVFMTWMLFLVTQTVWVARNDTKTHMKLGKYGFLWGLLLVAAGLFMMYVEIEAGVAKKVPIWSKVIPLVFATSVTDILRFVILLGLGYYYRASPAAHKRYMLFATIVIANAAASRWGILIGGWSHEIVNTFMVGPIWAYDLYHDKRIHKATLIGTGIVLLFFLNKYLLL